MPALALTALAADDDRRARWRRGFRCTWPSRSTSTPVRRRGRAGGAPARESILGHGRPQRAAGGTGRAATAIPIGRAVRDRLGRARRGARHGRGRGDRAARGGRAATESPELVDFVIVARTSIPLHAAARLVAGQGGTPEERAPIAFRALVAEIGRLLVELTGRSSSAGSSRSPSFAPAASVAGGGGELSAAQPRLACLSTGSAAFDRILGGGLPSAPSTSSRASRARARPSSRCRCSSTWRGRARSACT